MRGQRRQVVAVALIGFEVIERGYTNIGRAILAHFSSCFYIDAQNSPPPVFLRICRGDEFFYLRSPYNGDDDPWHAADAERLLAPMLLRNTRTLCGD